MTVLSIDALFDAAARIQLEEERVISFVFSENGISIRFPTTRRLAEYLGVPHYYVLPFFAMMEQEALVTRAERVGILTTPTGSSKLFLLILDRYREKAETILGKPIIEEIARSIERRENSPTTPRSLHQTQ